MSDDDKEEKEDGDRGRSPGIVTSYDEECPCCHQHFSSAAAYRNHPCVNK